MHTNIIASTQKYSLIRDLNVTVTDCHDFICTSPLCHQICFNVVDFMSDDL